MRKREKKYCLAVSASGSGADEELRKRGGWRGNCMYGEGVKHFV